MADTENGTVNLTLTADEYEAVMKMRREAERRQNGEIPSTSPEEKSNEAKQKSLEERRARREAAFAIADTEALAVATDPDRFLTYLDTQCRFSDYSVNNALLIMAQMPGATELKTFADWETAKSPVKRGQKGLDILEGKRFTGSDGKSHMAYFAKHVFDIRQTADYGRLSAEKDTPGSARGLCDAFKYIIDKESPVKVETIDMPFLHMMAQYDAEKKVLYVNRENENIMKNTGANFEALAKATACEIATAQIDANAGGKPINDTMGLCVGYMLCERYGVESQDLKHAIKIDFANLGLPKENPADIKHALSELRRSYVDIGNKVSERIGRKREPDEREDAGNGQMTSPARDEAAERG